LYPSFDAKIRPRHINEKMILIVLIAMEFELNEVIIDMKLMGKGLSGIIKKGIIPYHE